MGSVVVCGLERKAALGLKVALEPDRLALLRHFQERSEMRS